MKLTGVIETDEFYNKSVILKKSMQEDVHVNNCECRSSFKPFQYVLGYYALEALVVIQMICRILGICLAIATHILNQDPIKI